MKDLSKLSCAVYDHGQYCPFAQRLGRELGTVYYATPWESAFSRIDNRVVGEGFDEIQRVESLFDVLDKVDFVVFPDVHDAGMQLFLERQGMPVWGGRRADNLELKKLWFKRLIQSMDQPVSDFTVLNGMEKLREHLRKNNDLWIKTSPQFRGMIESFHHDDYESTKQLLAHMELEYGAMGQHTTFMAESPIKSRFEPGIDTYCIDGEHPDSIYTGWEIKDKCFFGEVKDYKDVDPDITKASEFIWPMLGELRCRQFVSTEVMLAEDGKSYFLEPTIRIPSPPGNEVFELYQNLGAIVASGASGILTQPEWNGKYGCEAIIEHKDDGKYPRHIEVPESEKKWVKLSFSAGVGDDKYWIAPLPHDIIGSVVGIGDSPREALEHLKANAECLESQPVVVHLTDLSKAIEEIESARDDGVKSFNHARLPEPAEVLT